MVLTGFYFIMIFTHKDKLRTYVSDASSFAQLIDVYEQRDKDRPMFAFEVTMQNQWRVL